MSIESHASQDTLSIQRGIPLSAEPGLGALTLPGYLLEVTEKFAAREALVMHKADGSVERWTYGELRERAMAVARALAACGVGKDCRVGVLMTNRPEWVASMFGVGLAGGVAVLLSTFSTAPELEFLLQASGISVLLFERTVLKKDFAAMLQTLEPGIGRAQPGQLSSTKFPFLHWLAAVGENDAAGGAAPAGALEPWPKFLARGREISPALIEARAAAVTPADPAALFFSSGSTGKPKGILSAHRGVTIQCWRWVRMFGLGDDVRTLTANGFFWSGNFGMALGGTLSCGGAIILQSSFEPVESLRLMEKERVTFPVAWPHQWAQLEAAANWATTDLSSLRYVDQSGPAGRHPAVKRTGYSEPKWAYGNTETFTISTAFAHDTPLEAAAGTHGEVLPGNTVKIVDALSGAILPRGSAGEIAVKGPTLMLGYIGVPIDETLDDTGFFATGDGGYLDERGRLVWQGRLNDIIKTGGANVSPLEVDAVLADCPGVKHSVTVGVPHETLGEMVVACVVTEDGGSLTEAIVRDFAKQRLASYKVPRRVLFLEEGDLSLTGSAKVKTGALRELAAKRLADGGSTPTA
jgi:fatty-acyl-CoA synthase